MKRSRAFTLIELLVTMVLTILFFTMAYQVLLPTLRIWAINQARAGIEETGVVIESHMLVDLERSTYKSLTILPGTANGLRAFSFMAVGATDTPDSFQSQTGLPVFQTYIIYFVPPNTTRIYRKIWPVSGQTPGAGVNPGDLPYSCPTTSPVALASADLVTLCQTVNGTETPVGGSVTDMTALSMPPDCIQITIDLATTSPDGIDTTERSQQFEFRM